MSPPYPAATQLRCQNHQTLVESAGQNVAASLTLFGLKFSQRVTIYQVFIIPREIQRSISILILLASVGSNLKQRLDNKGPLRRCCCEMKRCCPQRTRSIGVSPGLGESLDHPLESRPVRSVDKGGGTFDLLVHIGPALDEC